MIAFNCRIPLYNEKGYVWVLLEIVVLIEMIFLHIKGELYLMSPSKCRPSQGRGLSPPSPDSCDIYPLALTHGLVTYVALTVTQWPLTFYLVLSIFGKFINVFSRVFFPPMLWAFYIRKALDKTGRKRLPVGVEKENILLSSPGYKFR